MVLESGQLVPGMGALSDALEHESEASGNDWVGEVVLAALAGPVFGANIAHRLVFGAFQ